MAAGLRCVTVEQQVSKERLAARPRQAIDGHAVVVDTEVAKEVDAEVRVRSARKDSIGTAPSRWFLFVDAPAHSRA